MPKKFWQFRNQAGSDSAELLLYGDIAGEKSWYGDEVTPKEFAAELSALGNVSEITVRINSGGGDPFAAVEIGNLLERHPAYVTAIIGGVCASAATIIPCHCNKVIAANDSTYMIHPVKMGLFGYADAVTLQQYIEALNTIRENIVTLYAKKTGREKDEVAGWMDATSWWTGQQAKENGFVDELTDNGEDAVVENRNGAVFINSVSLNTSVENAPEFVQKRLAEHAARSIADKTVKNVKEENNMDIKTVDDLRAAHPDLVDQIEQAAAKAAAENAINAERARIQSIEDMALPGSEALAAEAKFTNPMSAEDFAKAMVKNAKTQGATYLAQVQKDVETSGINQVRNAAPADWASGDEFTAAIKAACEIK